MPAVESFAPGPEAKLDAAHDMAAAADEAVLSQAESADGGDMAAATEEGPDHGRMKRPFLRPAWRIGSKTSWISTRVSKEMPGCERKPRWKRVR